MAHEFYVTIEGTKQGKFKGQSQRDTHKNAIPCFGLSYEVMSPTDMSTGQHSGKRQHKPIRILHEWGAATPQLFQAVCTNEVLKNVQMDFVKTNANGEEYVYSTIKLTGATVSDLRFISGAEQSGGNGAATSAKHASTDNTHELVECALSFKRIEMENKDGKTSAIDDWSLGPVK